VTDVKAARAALDELSAVLGWLAASLLPGTAKPYRAPQMSAEKRQKRELEDRAYRLLALTGNTVPLGESPAPMDLSVMDLLSDVLVLADEIAEQVAAAAKITPLPAASSAFADPGPYLALAGQHLDAACTADDTLARWVESKCDDVILKAHHQLGLLGDGQVLAVVCPWCQGRTESKPSGGERTLRVRAVLPSGKRSVVGVSPDDVRWIVACDGLSCSPGDGEVGEWWRGRPAWDLKRWSTWLADQLEREKVAS
jgi:hypothetical protein